MQKYPSPGPLPSFPQIKKHVIIAMHYNKDDKVTKSYGPMFGRFKRDDHMLYLPHVSWIYWQAQVICKILLLQVILFANCPNYNAEDK